MTEENDVGFDAWRGKVVGGGDPNPFHHQVPVEETPKAEETEEPTVLGNSESEESARTIVTDGILPGAIFDANFMNEAIKKGYKISHSETGYKDHLGNPILEIVISDGHNEKIVGYTITSVGEAEQN